LPTSSPPQFSSKRFPSRFRAGNGIRTRDIQLGKLTLYQLSYARIAFSNRIRPYCLSRKSLDRRTYRPRTGPALKEKPAQNHASSVNEESEVSSSSGNNLNQNGTLSWPVILSKEYSLPSPQDQRAALNDYCNTRSCNACLDVCVRVALGMTVLTV
jgi:hypothetical protein